MFCLVTYESRFHQMSCPFGLGDCNTVTDPTRFPVLGPLPGILRDLEYVMLIMQFTCAIEY